MGLFWYLETFFKKILGAVEEVTIFEPLAMAPTWALPGLFLL